MRKQTFMALFVLGALCSLNLKAQCISDSINKIYVEGKYEEVIAMVDSSRAKQALLKDCMICLRYSESLQKSGFTAESIVYLEMFVHNMNTEQCYTKSECINTTANQHFNYSVIGKKAIISLTDAYIRLNEIKKADSLLRLMDMFPLVGECGSVLVYFKKETIKRRVIVERLLGRKDSANALLLHFTLSYENGIDKQGVKDLLTDWQELYTSNQIIAGYKKAMKEIYLDSTERFGQVFYQYQTTILGSKMCLSNCFETYVGKENLPTYKRIKHFMRNNELYEHIKKISNE